MDIIKKIDKVEVKGDCIYIDGKLHQQFGSTPLVIVCEQINQILVDKHSSSYLSSTVQTVTSGIMSNSSVNTTSCSFKGINIQGGNFSFGNGNVINGDGEVGNVVVTQDTGFIGTIMRKLKNSIFPSYFLNTPTHTIGITVLGNVMNDVKLLDGKVSIGSVGGNVTSSSGNIEIHGSVSNNVSSESGTITIKGDVGGDIKTNSGDVDCDGNCSGTHSTISTVSGDITVGGYVRQYDKKGSNKKRKTMGSEGENSQKKRKLEKSD